MPSHTFIRFNFYLASLLLLFSFSSSSLNRPCVYFSLFSIKNAQRMCEWVCYSLHLYVLKWKQEMFHCMQLNEKSSGCTIVSKCVRRAENKLKPIYSTKLWTVWLLLLLPRKHNAAAVTAATQNLQLKRHDICEIRWGNNAWLVKGVIKRNSSKAKRKQ